MRFIRLYARKKRKNFLPTSVTKFTRPTTNSITKKLVLTKELAQTEKAIANLIKALEAGIFSDATKARLDKTEYKKTLLELQLQNADLQDKNALTEKKILQYINQVQNLNPNLLVPLPVKNILVTKERVDIELKYTQVDKEADAKNRKTYNTTK